MLRQANDPVSRLYALADLIEFGFNNLKYNQTQWGSVCGTSACIAGHAVAAWDKEVWKNFIKAKTKCYSLGADELDQARYNAAAIDLADSAMKLLGLKQCEANSLFDSAAHRNDKHIAAKNLRDLAREKETAMVAAT